MSRSNGYMRLPTSEPNPVIQARAKDAERRRKLPKNLRPGLFHMFGERGKNVVDSGSEEEIELTEIKTGEKRWRRPKSPKSPKTPKLKKARHKTRLIHEPVQEGDTLRRVALRYGVPDSEIRRANNLYTDQDFFALKTVKIPIKENSLLTDSSELEKRRKIASSGTGGSENQSESNSDETRLGGPSTYYKSEEDEDSGDADDEKGDSDTLEYRNVSIQSALKWKLSGDSLLKKFDEDLERVRASTEQKVQNHRDVAVTLHYPKFYPVTRTSYENSLLSNIEWRWYVWGGLALLAVILVIIVTRAFWCGRHTCKSMIPLGT